MGEALAMLARDAPAGRLCPSCGGKVRAEGLTHCAAHVSEELGITYRQLDYWARQGYLCPEPRTDPTSGVNRTWPAGELEIARRMARLTSAGLAVERAAVFARESWPEGEIAPGITLAVTDMAADAGGGPIEGLWSGPGWQGMSVRTVNALRREGYETVADLLAAGSADLAGIRNFGAGCFAELRRVLSAHGLALAGEAEARHG